MVLNIDYSIRTKMNITQFIDALNPSEPYPLFPLTGGHGLSLYIQIISFQIWIELHD